MSRGDFGTQSSYGATSVSYHRTPTSKQTDKFNSLCDSISGKIFIINKNVSKLETLSKSIDDYDEKNCESKIHTLSQESNQLAKDIKNIFQEISDFTRTSRYDQYDINKQRQYNLLQNKLRKEFENSLSRYHAIQNVVSLKMKAFIQKEKEESSFHELSSTGNISFEIDDDRDNLIEENNKTQQLMVHELDLEEAKEREARLVQIEEDILNVNEIFRDLAVIVHEQGEAIDSIESHIEHAAIHVEHGNQQLTRASSYQKSARKKMCILALVTLVIATIVILIIYFSVK